MSDSGSATGLALLRYLMDYFFEAIFSLAVNVPSWLEAIERVAISHFFNPSKRSWSEAFGGFILSSTGELICTSD